MYVMTLESSSLYNLAEKSHPVVTLYVIYIVLNSISQNGKKKNVYTLLILSLATVIGSLGRFKLQNYFHIP